MTSRVVSYLSLGSNLGTREENVLKAVWRVSSLPGVGVSALSSLYESQPQNVETNGIFVNAVCKLSTSLEPEGLLHQLMSLEKEMGRERCPGEVDRTIDLDILLFGDEVIAGEDLVIPHPRLRERCFVLIPLLEIEPSLRIPPDGISAREALSALGDEFWVRRISGRMFI